MELGAADRSPPPGHGTLPRSLGNTGAPSGAAGRVGEHGVMREQRLVFGEVAELYDRVRAGYPDAAVDDVIGFAGADGPLLRALEVGAGTGKATVSFAARGLEILALEPSAEMAAVARRNCRPFPRVRVESVTFEDWPAAAGRFGLVFSAQAWHWVRPEVRYGKAAEALRAGGTLALLWNRVRWQGEPLRDDLEDLYRRLAPDLYARHPAFPGLTARPEDGDRGDEMRRTGLFQDEAVRTSTRGRRPSPPTRSSTCCRASPTTACWPRTSGPGCCARYGRSSRPTAARSRCPRHPPGHGAPARLTGPRGPAVPYDRD
jgi:SAM-dependent methyltransferase